MTFYLFYIYYIKFYFIKRTKQFVYYERHLAQIKNSKIMKRK